MTPPLQGAAEASAQPWTEKRTSPDRRQTSTSPWTALFRPGQRARNRRRSERAQLYFVDRFSPVMWTLLLVILVSSVVDAVLTLHLIQAGGKELNPVMQGVLGHGVVAFLVVKYLLTAIGLPLLLVYKNHRLCGTWLRVGYLIPVIAMLYMVLIAYQCILIHNNVGW